MILDEPMEMPIKRPFTASCNGDKFTADIFEFLPPGPQMAKDQAKMIRYFNTMQKAAATFLINNMGDDQIQEQARLQAGGTIKSLHEEYSDDNPEAKEAKLKEIEETIEGFMQMLEMCDELDTYKMTCDFGNMVINNKRCFIKGKNESGEDCRVALTSSLWDSSIYLVDRIAAMFRYCCFFDLTSSAPN